MADGQLALNTNNTSPGLFFKDSNGALVKVGPVHVGTTAPNASPAAGGSTGNAIGEQWLDTAGGTYVFKVWDGSAWRSESGTFVDVNGDVMTGALGIIAGSVGSPGLYFSGDTNTGIYSPGADQVAISTNGTGRLFVDASGNVDIRSTAPVLNIVDTDTARAGAVNSFIAFRGSDDQKAYIGCPGTGDTRIWGRTADPILLGTNDTERLRITSAGLVGIGISDPGSLLTLGTTAPRLEFNDGDAATDNKRWQFFTGSTSFGLRALTDAGAAGGNQFSFTRSNENINSFQASASGAPWFFVDNSTQRVGIGTTSPRYNLSLGSTAITSTASPDTIDLGGTFSNTAGANLKLRLYWDGTTPQGFGISAFQMDYVAASNAAHVFYRGTSEAARIDASSRLLVGTSSARTKYANILQTETISGGSSYGFTTVYNGNDVFGSAIALGKSRGTIAGSNTIVASGDSLGAIQFVGADGTDLESAASIEAFVDGTPGANDMPGRLVFSTTADGASSTTERLRIDSSGSIILGGSTSGTAGTVTFLPNYSTGSGTFIAATPLLYWNRTASNSTGTACLFQNSGATVGTITYTASSTAYTTTSDYRLKENVTVVTNGITRLQQLKPSRFNFIADPGHTVDGFIAHEVQSVVPEAITGTKDEVDADGKPVYQGIDQSKLVPLLTAALQEAVAEIESLEARLTAAGI